MSLSVFALLAAIISNSAANILIKKASAHEIGLALYLTPWFISGAALYGVSLATYTLALKTIPLSIAYPILISGSLIVVAFYALFFLQEPFGISRFIGFSLLLAGVALVAK